MQVGVFPTENAQIGFLFDQQESQLELKGTGERKEEVADLAVRNYHGVFRSNRDSI